MRRRNSGLRGERGLVAASRGRLRERGSAAVTRALRLSVGAVAAYLIAIGTVSDPRPVTAALTAVLIVQVTLVGTVADMVRRIISVVVGVGIAIGVSDIAGFTWWSLGGLVAASILIGQLLRLGVHLYEVPISAMVVLAAGGAGAQATDRIVETVIGAGVGVLVNVIAPPSPRARNAGAAVQQFAARIAGLLERISAACRHHGPSREEARAWLQELRQITAAANTVDTALAEASERRRLNPRAVGTADPTPDLRTGLDSLEHSTVALRAVFRSIADGAAPASGQDAAPGEIGDEDFRMAFAELMSDLARAFSGFGALVRAEADQGGEVHTEELAEALEAVREARVRLTELLLVDPGDARGLWQLHGSLLAAVDRVLAELDLEEHARRRERHRQEALALRGPASLAAQRLRSSTRRVVAENPALRISRQRRLRRPPGS